MELAFCHPAPHLQAACRHYSPVLLHCAAHRRDNQPAHGRPMHSQSLLTLMRLRLWASSSAAVSCGVACGLRLGRVAVLALQGNTKAPVAIQVDTDTRALRVCMAAAPNLQLVAAGHQTRRAGTPLAPLQQAGAGCWAGSCDAAAPNTTKRHLRSALASLSSSSHSSSASSSSPSPARAAAALGVSFRVSRSDRRVGCSGQRSRHSADCPEAGRIVGQGREVELLAGRCEHRAAGRQSARRRRCHRPAPTEDAPAAPSPCASCPRPSWWAFRRPAAPAAPRERRSMPAQVCSCLHLVCMRTRPNGSDRVGKGARASGGQR